MANMSEHDQTQAPGWDVDCRKAARDRVRRRLGDAERQREAKAAREREEAAALLSRRSRGKLTPPAEDDVIALRFSEPDDRQSRRHH